VDERLHFHHRRDRRIVAEELLVRPAVVGPPRDVGHEHACADDVLRVSAEVAEGFLDDLEAALGLSVGVTGAKTPPLLSEAAVPEM